MSSLAKIGEMSGARKMIGMHMRVQNIGDLPAGMLGNFDIDLWRHTSIDYGGLLSAGNDIREASFACSTYLYYPYTAIPKPNIRTVPGKAPGFHSTSQAERLVSEIPQLLSRDG